LIALKIHSKTARWRFRTGAFSLIESLVVVGIVLILAAVGIPFGSSCLEKSRSMREISGARSAIAAWQVYASENDGAVLRGYLPSSPLDPATKTPVYKEDGTEVGYPAKIRYPYRLAPYLSYRLNGTLLVNKQANLTSEYDVSMKPSLGLNITFVGGDWGGGSDLQPTEANLAKYGQFVVTKVQQIHSPSKLLVFASARFEDSPEGYNAVKSPNLQSERWGGNYEESAPYYDFGNVHPRYDGRAVCAMADGHVELLSIDQLRDMRRWSNQAAEANDPNWTLQ
jgi:prepilin-type processing-associated H-X9-DG protein